MNDHTDLHDRIRGLTPLQRALLARRLDAAAPPPEPEPGPAQLVAYVVPEAGPAPSGADVRAFLQARVPDFMVPSVVVVLDELPRTPNGKIDRRALPAPGAADPFDAAGYTPPRNPVEEQLAAIWAEVLGFDRIGVYDNFFEIGGDSILSIQIISRANQAGLKLKPSQFFEHPTIAALAAVAGTAAPAPVDEKPSAGPVPLTPIQHWFFEQTLPEPSHWNQVLTLDVARSADRDRLLDALRTTAAHHDALRLRFAREAGGWVQTLALPEATAVAVTRHDLAATPIEAQEPAIERIRAASQDALDLADGPLRRADLIDRGAGAPYRLVLTAHHLVVDVVSWQTLLADAETIYAQLGRGEAPAPPASGTAFGRWAKALQEHAATGTARDERSYWLGQAARPAGTLPTDSAGPNTEASARTHTTVLDARETQALLDAPAAYGMKVPELFLTALAHTLAAWTDASPVRIDVEGHGREGLGDDLDVARTVGWFTTLYPVVLQPDTLDDPRRALTTTKEQLRSVPRQGIGYGLLRYLADDSARTRLAQTDAEVLFNYTGRTAPRFSEGSPFQTPFQLWGSRHEDGTRGHLLEINASIVDDALIVYWTYSTNRHEPATIRRLADDTLAALRTLVAHCLDPEAGGYTPSDFPDIDLDQDGLDALLGDL